MPQSGALLFGTLGHPLATRALRHKGQTGLMPKFWLIGAVTPSRARAGRRFVLSTLLATAAVHRDPDARFAQ